MALVNGPSSAFSGVVNFSSLPANSMVGLDGSKNLVAKVAGTDYATGIQGAKADAAATQASFGLEVQQRLTAVRDLVGESADAVDARIAGKTASATTVNLLSSRDDSGAGTYVRNPTMWAADLDLTCGSIYSTGATTSHWETGTAISPRHVLMAKHFWPSGTDASNVPTGTPPVAPGNGATLRFVTATGVTVTRTILSVQQAAPPSDILIGVLDQDLPPSITPAKVLPPNYQSRGSLAGGVAVFYNRLLQVSNGSIQKLDASNGLLLGATTDPQRLAFSINVSVGDSSHPIFLVVNGNQPVLLGCFHTYTGGADVLLTQNFAAVNAAMASLTNANPPTSGNSANYQLTTATLPLGGSVSRAAFLVPSYDPFPGSLVQSDTNGLISPQRVPGEAGADITVTGGTYVPDDTVREVRLAAPLTSPLTVKLPYRDSAAAVVSRAFKVVDGSGYSSAACPVLVSPTDPGKGLTPNTLNGASADVTVLKGAGAVRADFGSGLDWTAPPYAVNDLRLSANIPRLDGNNTFTATGGVNAARFNLTGTTNPAALIQEVGTIATLGINVPQVGTRNTARSGGIFRLDTRTAAETGINGGFNVFRYPTGSATETLALYTDFETGQTRLESLAVTGAATVGGKVVATVPDAYANAFIFG